MAKSTHVLAIVSLITLSVEPEDSAVGGHFVVSGTLTVDRALNGSGGTEIATSGEDVIQIWSANETEELVGSFDTNLLPEFKTIVEVDL